ncbi:Thrombin inhibitor hemalin [Lemmus lemmus]
MAYFPRWFYNKENSTCQLFIYGGCQGNNNNFQSQSLCQNVCQKKTLLLQVFRKPLPALCKLPMEKGECRATLLRWHYNIKSGKCERFSYGGCGGNENNFLSRNQCRLACRRP